MPFTYQDKIELIQLQALETAHPESVKIAAPQKLTQGMLFETWLNQRLTGFKGQQANAELIDRAPSWYRRLLWVLWAAGLLLGFVSATSLLPAQQQLNIFWLFGALLGAHTLTLGLWIVFIGLLHSRNPGPVSAAVVWLTEGVMRLRKSNSPAQTALLAWWQARLQAPLRRWQLGLFTHIVWLAFLLGSALGLTLIFTTQQYDFVWQSTLLSDQQLTQLLDAFTRPMQMMGLPLPNLGDPAEQQRRLWALFTLLGLFLYGVLPRAAALTLTSLWLRMRQLKWKLDLSQSYFIHLHRQFSQLQQRATILDDDSESPKANMPLPSFAANPLPKQGHWYGVEVDPRQPWQQLTPNFKGYINSYHDLQNELNQQPVETAQRVLFVEGQRLADRGQKRLLQALCSEHNWLVIIDNGQLGEEQLQAWQQVAAELQWPSDHLALMRLAA